MLRKQAATAMAILAGVALVVWGAGDSVWPINVEPGESIQEAIDAAPEGGVVYLGEGCWVENLDVDKSLTLVGVAGNTTIQGAEEDVPVFRVSGPDDRTITVHLVGLTITGGVGWDGPGLFACGGAKVIVSDVCITGNEKYGIHLRGTSQAAIAHSTVLRNGSTGLHLSDDAAATVSHSAILENTGNGISAESTPRLVLVDSTIARNGQYGIYTRLSAQAVIVGSTMEGNKYGIVLTHSSRATVVRSTLRANEYGGVLLGDSVMLMLEGNGILQNGGYGVKVNMPPCTENAAIFAGYVAGAANDIPESGEAGGNRLGGWCPGDLAFLTSVDGGELDQREP
ncbi:MAG: right-handed parallel beta-helix repeat-containing protein [Candidatus Bipolaricaulota bacterium]